MYSFTGWTILRKLAFQDGRGWQGVTRQSWGGSGEVPKCPTSSWNKNVRSKKYFVHISISNGIWARLSQHTETQWLFWFCLLWKIFSLNCCIFKWTYFPVPRQLPRVVSQKIKNIVWSELSTQRTLRIQVHLLRGESTLWDTGTSGSLAFTGRNLIKCVSYCHDWWDHCCWPSFMWKAGT